MKYKRRARLLALFLGLSLALSPAAAALTPEQAGQLLDLYYIDDVPEEVLEQPTISAMLEALGDPYTQYFTPEEYALFTSSMSDTQLAGIGVLSLVTESGALIQRVYEDTPAGEAGLLAGDLITAVDGVSTAGLNTEEVADLLRGEPGTRVRVTYLREGERHTVSLTRAAVTIPTAYTELWNGRIGYIDCDTFGGETEAHFAEGMETYGELAQRWIVDLRGNGGGVVDAAMGAAGVFTGRGLLAYLKDSDGSFQAYGSNDSALTDKPVVVLTDGDTASASELFASDIRDTRSGLLVGGRTFGKGVAQLVLDGTSLPGFFDDGDAIKITTYRFYAPNGTTTDTVGLFPHLMVDPALAGEVAVLLSSSAPVETSEGYLCLSFEDAGYWYVSLSEASAPEYVDALTALLEAVPNTVRLQVGMAGGWADMSPGEVAELCGLTGYRDRSFTDTADSPYANAIDLLATYGVLSGGGDGTFRPTGTLTRAELCAMLAQALNCRVPAGESQFSDVSLEDWYGICVNAVARLGLVEGVGDGRFDPDGLVTHEQLITIMARVARKLNMAMELSAPAEGELESGAFLPYASWARESAWLLSEHRQGSEGGAPSLLWAGLEEIQPAGPATREEAAALTCSLLTYLGILPS